MKYTMGKRCRQMKYERKAKHDALGETFIIKQEITKQNPQKPRPISVAGKRWANWNFYNGEHRSF